MRTYKRSLLLLLASLAVTLVTAMAALNINKQVSQSSENQSHQTSSNQPRVDSEEFKGQFPIADSITGEISDPEQQAKRQAKNQKFDKARVPVEESTDQIVAYTGWANGLPALPVNQSQAIVIGKIADAHAYLSNDKTGVYSEFTVHISDMLANKSETPLSANNSISVERVGGRVRFPSGHIATFYIDGQNMPRTGKRYVLFLTHNGPSNEPQDQDFFILTGYELQGGHALPLDNPGGGTQPIAKTYRDADETTFLNDLRLAIAKSN